MARLEIEIHSYWHAGSGRGRGAEADAVVVRTPAGLPYLPGRTLKGLVRDALWLAEQAGQVAEGRTRQLFGGRRTPEETEDTKGEGRFQAEPGMLRFSDARLGATDGERRAWEEWPARGKDRGIVEQLSSTISSTKIDEAGLAAHRTLRTMEVVAPLTLHAFVEPVDGCDPGNWQEDLRRAVPLLRGIGSKRSRGFGRCTVRLIAEGEGGQ
jgi:hypothetical protein